MRALAALALSCAACTAVDPGHVLPPAGGDTTTSDRTSGAYEAPAPNLDAAGLEQHLAGDVSFGAVFVSAPAEVNPGLGPVFNHRACEGCHIGNGRGLPVAGQGPLGSQLLVRVSLPAEAGEPGAPGGSVPVPGLGLQVGDHAIYGHQPEARVEIAWEELPGIYADGEPYSLRRPIVIVKTMDGQPLAAEVMTSARIPPPVFGLGLLEAIPEADLLALADPDDLDGDGISGRANRVWSPSHGAPLVGRFGLKANNATLVDQAAGAYADDMGVSSPLFPEGDTVDVPLEEVERAAFYTQTLAVPRRAEPNAEAERGLSLFSDAGCAGCHVPVQQTGPDHPIAALREQSFAPFTDLLLHDMGEELADGRPDYLASGREWRTPPLWGVGLVGRVLGDEVYLHDGRARSLAEAILWHGGEAEAARDAFRTMAAADRAALLAFLRTL